MKKFKLISLLLPLSIATMALANTQTLESTKPLETKSSIEVTQELTQTQPAEKKERAEKNEPALEQSVEEKVIIEKQPIEEKEIMVGYYGRPYAKMLGILGETPIDIATQKLKMACEAFEDIEGIKVRPTYHIIYDLATLEAGSDKDHIKPLGNDALMKYITRAQEENFAVIIDLQLGTKRPVDAIEPLLQYLKYPNVHLALDPEFKVPSDARYRPGKFIGHIFGEDVNAVQQRMSEYMQQEGITEKKTLIVHMFTKRMLRKKEVIQNNEQINLVFNIDGHGHKSAKIKIYNAIYNEEAQKIAQSGFKIFYKNDKKPLMTPRQILGLDGFKNRKLNSMPVYINFQ